MKGDRCITVPFFLKKSIRSDFMIEKVKQLIADQLYISADEVSLESKFVEDLGADSLDIVQMLIAMENEFGVSFDDDELTTVKTVADAINLINSKK